MSPDQGPSRVKPSRVLIKISGAGLGGDRPLQPEAVKYIVSQVKEARSLGFEIALVVGGGNIIRGKQQQLLSRTAGDFAGMVATIVNGIFLKSMFQRLDIPVLMQSALPISRIAGSVDLDRAVSRLCDGNVVIFVGGTGNPYFTTDSAAALRAGEIGADLVLKGTNVKGVYTKDPSEEGAEFVPALTYKELAENELGVIDLTAAKIGQETKIPMIIYDLFTEGATSKALKGKEVGTYVYAESERKKQST